jgi:hypothetical protein
MVGSYSTEHYLYLVERWHVPLVMLMYWCVLSTLVEPVVMILVKKGHRSDLFHLPMGVWYVWSVLPAYVQGSLKGFFGIKTGWFCTPKFNRGELGALSRLSSGVRLANAVFCAFVLGIYFLEGWTFGWHDPFALLLVPACVLATVE